MCCMNSNRTHICIYENLQIHTVTREEARGVVLVVHLSAEYQPKN